MTDIAQQPSEHFVVAEETGDEADFVVAESAADDEADFVVAETTDDDTAIGDVADFVPSKEPPTEAESDFVVAAEVDEEVADAEAVDESDTVHNMHANQVAAKQKAKGPASRAASTSTLARGAWLRLLGVWACQTVLSITARRSSSTM